MAKRTINNSQLTAGAVYFVKGHVTFSRVSRPTTDEERIKANARRQIAVDKNYTTISLCDAQVIAADPQNPTIEERYAYECLYKSSKPEYTGHCFSAMNKGSVLPVIRVKNETTGEYDAVKIEHELANGLEVTVGMRVFKGVGGNNGVSLDTIIVNGPIKYYEPENAVSKAALKTLGVVFSAPAPETAPAESSEKVEEITATEEPANTAPAPTETPFSSAPTPVEDNNPFAAAEGNPFVSADSIGVGNRKY
jgi:hypothetical protein